MQFLVVLRHLEGFLEKSEESRPPPKLKNNGVPKATLSASKWQFHKKISDFRKWPVMAQKRRGNFVLQKRKVFLHWPVSSPSEVDN